MTEINPLFQVLNDGTNTYYQEMISAGGGAVAIRTLRQDGLLTTRYLVHDHLGSATLQTDESGNLTCETAYDAFGNPRDPSTGQSTTKDCAGNGHGYTDQMSMAGLGLIHMNGRVYDPIIGRMVSADPTVPDPMFSQAFNRYAYVYNNPMNATDPSGFDSDPLPNGYTCNAIEGCFSFTYHGCVGSCDFLGTTTPNPSGIDIPDQQLPLLPPPPLPNSVTLGKVDVTANKNSANNQNSPAAKNIFGGTPSPDTQTPYNNEADALRCMDCHWTDNASPASLESLGADFEFSGNAAATAAFLHQLSMQSPSGAGPMARPNAGCTGGSTGCTTGQKARSGDDGHGLALTGDANGVLGAGFTATELNLVRNGMWRGHTGDWYKVGEYFGNQYGWTAASAKMGADVLHTAGKVGLGAGLIVSAASYFKDVRKGDTPMAIRDSIDVPMGAAALEFPFGTAVSGVWFGGELLYDLHEANPYMPMPLIY